MELHTIITRPDAPVDATVCTTVDHAVGTVMEGDVGTNEAGGNDVVLQKDGNPSTVTM